MACGLQPDSNPELRRSLAACRRLTRHHARSFYFSSHFLPRPRREAAYAIYAFCRHADDLLDLPPAPSPEDPQRRLNDLLERLYRGAAREWAFNTAFHHAVTSYGIPRALFEELIEGVCSDRGRVRIRDFGQLEVYCHRVASVVGLMMARIFGLSDPSGEKPAADLGTAMQLTNILRDIAEDFRRDRIYLPSEEMARFGVSESDLREGRAPPSFVALMKFQVARARRYYRESEKGIPLLANDGSQFTVWAMRWIYAGILDEIEKADYDVFRRRARVRLPRKLALALKARRCCRSQAAPV